MKIRHLLIFILILLQSSMVFAGLVTKDDARIVAYNFVKERIINGQSNWDLNTLTMTDERTVSENCLPLYYIFSNNGTGYIIISAEDFFTPVIGYSFLGSLPEEGNNKNFDSFLKSYNEQISWTRSHTGVYDGAYDTQWNNYKYGSIVDGSNASTDVAPMLLVMWNQDSPYNMFCPEDPAGPGGHVYAGCVATAMSLIMYYYRYPEHGTGSHSYYCPGYGTLSVNFGDTYYDWNQMLNSISGSSGECIPAVALLQYHCGVGVDMGYGADASGAYSTDVPYAMKNFFGYAPSVQDLSRSSYTAANWESMVVEQLDAAKPIFYAGQSPDGGHAFVCDGYQVTGSTKTFHFNFGWGGAENGYFTLANPNGFTSQQHMVRNIYPASNYPEYCSDHTLNVPIGSFEDGSSPRSDYQANSNCTWLISPENPVAKINIKFTFFDLHTSDSLIVYNGENEDAERIGAFTGNSLPANIIASSGKAFLKFITDGANQSKGFQIEYSSTYITYCGGTQYLNDPTGSFGDGSGEYNYNNASVCKYRINPPNASGLTVNFSEFDLADEDFVKIFALSNNESIGQFYGNTIPDPITTPFGGMLIIFTSNSFGTSGGFSATYSIGNVDNEKPENVVRMQLTPNPAQDITTLRLYATKQEANTLLIYDNAGKLVESRIINCNSGLNSINLDISNLLPGIYNLKLFSDSGTLSSRLVVK